MKQKLTSLFMVLCLTAGLWAALPMTTFASTSGTCGENLTWTLDDEGTLTISGTGDMYDYDSASVTPWYSLRSDVAAIIINNGVITIGKHAFQYCWAATEIKIPNSVTSIGNSAFDSCNNITSINIPGSVTAIGNAAFMDCSRLTSVVISDGVRSIGGSAFMDCTKLTSVTIPRSITSINIYAFYCSSIRSGNVYYTGSKEDWDNIDIGSYNTSLINATKHYNYGISANGTCGDGVCWSYSDETLTINGSGRITLTYGNAKPWGNYSDSISKIVIEKGVTYIPPSAFTDLDNLKEVQLSYTVMGEVYYLIFPNSTDYVVKGYEHSFADEYAQKHDLTFESIGVMPDEILQSGTCGEQVSWSFSTYGAFVLSGNGAMYDYGDGWDDDDDTPLVPWYEYIKHIKSVTVNEGVSHIGNNAFYYSYGGQTITSLSLPDSLRSIGDNAFCYALNIESITFPKKLESVGYQAFRLCHLKEVTFPDSMRTIGDYAFYVNNFRRINLGNGVRDIGKFAFSGQYTGAGEEECKLESVTIPNSVKNMEASFCWCYDLKNIVIDNSSEHLKSVDGVVYSKNGKKLFFCPTVTETECFEVPDGTEVICERAFDGCENIKELILPEGLTTLGAAFASGCTSLEMMYIPSTVTTLAYTTFFSSEWYSNKEIADIYYAGSEEEWNTLTDGLTYQTLYGENTNFHWNAVRETSDHLIISYNNYVLTVNSPKAYSGAKLLAALYQGERLLSVTPVSVDLTEGTNAISSPVTNYGNADTVKFMLWSGTGSMQPLGAACTVILKNTISYSTSANAVTLNSTTAVSGAKLLAALYQGEKLLSVTPVSVDLAEGINTMNSPVTNYGNADTVKFMLWSGTSNMQPLCAACEVTPNQTASAD